MKKRVLRLSAAFLLIHSFSFAQKPEVDSKKIIEEGIELHDKEDYKGAIEKFKKVNLNDTNFVLASIELINSYIASQQDSLAIIVCDKISVVPSSYAPSILIYKANALDNLKRSDEAVKLYQEGIKKYPNNNSFYYELGVLKYRQEKYKEAEEYFIQSIKCNPFHAGSHHQMANLAIKQGKLIPAMLAWQYYLLVDNSSKRAMSIINELEKMARNEYEFKDVIKIEGEEEQNDFSEIEALVKSKVALKDKYKSTINLKYNLNKQMQLIFEKMSVVKADKGFYMQFYAPIFEEAYKKNFFEPFTYSILGGLKNEEVDNWLKKNKDDTQKFSTWFLEYIGSGFSTYESVLNGKKVAARHWYVRNKIAAVGNQNAQGMPIDYWNYYFSNGILRSEGMYNSSGKREGVWKFYAESGVISDIENYKNGNIEGIVESYFKNGGIEAQKNYVNSILEGVQTTYYPTGAKKGSYEYKNNQQEGKEISYYQNGQLQYELLMTGGKAQGPYIQYYNSGHVKEKATFKDNLYIGRYQSFYNFPENTLSIDVTYEKGKPVGAYKAYFRNGKTSSEGQYNKDGQKDGLWKKYNDEGNLVEEEEFSDGKSSGSTKYYSDNGKLVEEFVFKNDFLQEYKAFDLAGNPVYQNKKEGKNSYDATLYHYNGNKKREGKVQSGKFVGEWKDYNMNGVLIELDNYVEGSKDGKSMTYYDNGKLNTETDYSHGETNGYYRKYFKNGKLKMEGAYIQDKEIGSWITYWINGNQKAVNFYNDGNLDGWQEYYAPNGKREHEEFYELGYVKKRVFYDSTGVIEYEVVFEKGTGDMNPKYKNGQTKAKYSYKDDMLKGPFAAFYPSGKPLSNKNFVNGELSGETKYYYPDGTLQWVRSYTDGDINGKEIAYHENGKVERENDYLYGVQEGKASIYFESGKLERQYDYKNDEIHGKSVIYAENGEIAIERNYKMGYLISYTYSDKNGAMLPPIEVKNETAKIKSYYKNGNPAIEYEIKNGCTEGKRTLYYPNGKIQEEGFYIGNELEGMRKYYYASGAIMEETNFTSDESNGKSVKYYENGKVKSEEIFLAGERHGACKYYDVSGKLTKTLVYYNDELLDEK